MQNKLNALIAHLNALPESLFGFPPAFLFTTAKTFKVPGRIVRESFLGNSKKLSPGRYGVSDVVVTEKPRKTYEKRTDKPVKVAKTIKIQKVSAVKISTEAFEDRKNLIAKIAKQDKSDRDYVKSLNKGQIHTAVTTPEEVDFAEELETLQKSSTMFVG